jgi:hypothetical protein
MPAGPVSCPGWAPYVTDFGRSFRVPVIELGDRARAMLAVENLGDAASRRRAINARFHPYRP